MAYIDTKQLTILKYLTLYLGQIAGIDVQRRDDQGNPLVLQDGSGAPDLEQVDLVNRVFRGRTVFGAEEYNPFLSILEGKRPDQAPELVGYDGLVRNEIWHLLIQGFQEDDEENPLDNLYRLKGMVERKLAKLILVDPSTGVPAYPADYLMQGLINEMTIGPGIVRPANVSQGGTEAFYLPITITFTMNVGDPYSLGVGSNFAMPSIFTTDDD